MTGQIGVNEFYAGLDQNNISRSAKIDSLVRSTEAGNVPRFSEFGKYILREANGTDMYNRVDKVSINSNRLVTTGNSGRAFGIAQAKMTDTVLDEIVKENQERFLSDVRVPKKGKGVSSVNQQHSSINDVLNMEAAKARGADSENLRTIKMKNLRDQCNSGGNLITWQ
jgi:DNA polymerase III gamma/tau subunit